MTGGEYPEGVDFVVKQAARRARNPADREDIQQEAALAVLEAQKKGISGRDLRHYVDAKLHRVEWAKSRDRVEDASIDLGEMPDEAEEYPLDISDELEALPPTEGIAMTLHRHGKTQKEIAASLGMTQRGAGKAIERGLLALKKKFRPSSI